MAYSGSAARQLTAPRSTRNLSSVIRKLTAVPKGQRSFGDCGKCGSKKYESGFSWCQPCRATGAALHAVWREAHRETGLCTECCVKRKRGEYISGPAHARGRIYMKCDAHLEYHRAWFAAAYKAARKAGQCVRVGCEKKADGAYCAEHAERVRAERQKRAA